MARTLSQRYYSMALSYWSDKNLFFENHFSLCIL
jgi:hypothetical protein